MNWIIGILLLATIADKIYAFKYIREGKNETIKAKDATIESLKQQLELSEKNNDVKITALYKERYDNAMLLLDEREQFIVKLQTQINGNESTGEKLLMILNKKLSEELASIRKEIDTERMLNSLKPKPLSLGGLFQSSGQSFL